TSSTTTKSKRTKTQQSTAKTSTGVTDPFVNAKDIIQKALAAPNSFTAPRDEDEFRAWLLSVSEYAKSLEGSVAVAESSGQLGPPPKTTEQLATEAARIADAVNKGLSRQMPTEQWRSTCTEGRAKYEYDGVCPDPRVFGAMLKLDGPPQWGKKKYAVEEFEACIGKVESPVQYATLVLTSDISLEWKEETGQFKLKGKYGKLGFDSKPKRYY
ncbi:hypothetical protein FRC07_014367, partial [Ceratobasidium sp. 392]